MFFIRVVYITKKIKNAKWCDTFKIGKCKTALVFSSPTYWGAAHPVYSQGTCT